MCSTPQAAHACCAEFLTARLSVQGMPSASERRRKHLRMSACCAVHPLTCIYFSAESLAARPSVQGMPNAFERRRQQADLERVVLLETLLTLQSADSTALPAEDWLKLASSVAGALYARSPSAAQAVAGDKAQHMVRIAHPLHHPLVFR